MLLPRRFYTTKTQTSRGTRRLRRQPSEDSDQGECRQASNAELLSNYVNYVGGLRSLLPARGGATVLTGRAPLLNNANLAATRCFTELIACGRIL